MFDFTIKPDGGEPFTVQAGTRDVLTWERTTKGASVMALLREWRMVDLYKLAHTAARRQGLFDGPLTDFEANCELEARETPAPDPTPPAP